MNGVVSLQSAAMDLPKGVQNIRTLPDPGLDALWDSIVVEEALKDQLVSQAVLNFTMRGKVDRTVIPLHGVILLTGEPGTGKTSLGKGLAQKTASLFTGSSFKLIEIEPHSLANSAMGKTQKAVSELFSQTIAEVAQAGPTVVLLDEVESLAVDRSRLSLDANPIDIHRATDAVLVQLDSLAERYPRLLFVATSNFPEAVDEAFTSRCDLVLKVPLPGEAACAKILRDCLQGLGRTYPPIKMLAQSGGLAQVAAECVGLDGRAIRKMVANALASRRQTAIDPSGLAVDQLLAAAKAAKFNRAKKAKAK